ncbi:MAG TPA: lysylphosphatidylglycerol synthase transmembrane domain-containing protein [Desulfovibrio sp.]|uniref:lysylphosphatidylglycerol synthase transmembrane domain-containing protein n=1 Tax=Desulfovibrio sp. TaxID=885 RepID=UPI002CE6218A|nr:lysylphosphatidylglycerol synthase transmembrane domain-containing protein [Desulfovibrio sp.]HMM38439.1 lysylphosphatidylglycerol synthase transmembrane domain-containing protein [Desulfovibrio sp.]
MNAPRTPSIIRRTLSMTLRLGLVAACVVYSLWNVDVSRILSALAAFHVLPLFISLLLAAVIFLLQGIRFRAITGPRATLAQTTMTCVLGNGLNSIFPARLGELGKALYLKRHAGIPVRESLGLIFWERFADLNMILLLAVLASYVSGKEFFWLPLAVGLAGIWLGVAAIILFPAMRGFIPRLIPVQGLRDICADMLAHFAAITTPAFLLRLVSLSALTWTMLAATFAYIVNEVTGLGGMAMILTVYVASSLSFLIPSSPGGLGLFEATMVFAFEWYGINKEAALTIAVLLRLTQCVPTVVIAISFLSREQLSLKALRSAMETMGHGGGKAGP